MFPVASKVMLGVLFSAKTSCSLPLHAVSSMYRKLFSSHCCTALSMSWCEGSNCCVIKRPGSLDFSWFTLSTFSAKGRTFVSECSVRSTFCLKSCKHRAWLSKKSLLNFERSLGASPRAPSKKAIRGFSSDCPGWYWLQNAYFAKVSTPASSSASTSAAVKSIWWALCWNATLLSSAIRFGHSLAPTKQGEIRFCMYRWGVKLAFILSHPCTRLHPFFMLSYEQKRKNWNGCAIIHELSTSPYPDRASLDGYVAGDVPGSSYPDMACHSAHPLWRGRGCWETLETDWFYEKAYLQKELMFESIWSSWLKTNWYGSFLWVPWICTVWHSCSCRKIDMTE